MKLEADQRKEERSQWKIHLNATASRFPSSQTWVFFSSLSFHLRFRFCHWIDSSHVFSSWNFPSDRKRMMGQDNSLFCFIRFSETWFKEFVWPLWSQERERETSREDRDKKRRSMIQSISLVFSFWEKHLHSLLSLSLIYIWINTFDFYSPSLSPGQFIQAKDWLEWEEETDFVSDCVTHSLLVWLNWQDGIHFSVNLSFLLISSL